MGRNIVHGSSRNIMDNHPRQRSPVSSNSFTLCTRIHYSVQTATFLESLQFVDATTHVDKSFPTLIRAGKSAYYRPAHRSQRPVHSHWQRKPAPTSGPHESTHYAQDSVPKSGALPRNRTLLPKTPPSVWWLARCSCHSPTLHTRVNAPG